MTDGNAITVDTLFQEIMGRRAGLIKALTTDAEEFYANCDPNRSTLCLYGNPDGSWEVNSPPEDVPADFPETVQGINFVRDRMQRNDWFAFVAEYSDAWILSVAFFFGGRHKFDVADRQSLFNMINDLPTILEVVTGVAYEVVAEHSPKNDEVVAMDENEKAEHEEALLDENKVEDKKAEKAPWGYSVEDIVQDAMGRRAGLIKALTTDVDEVYKQCSFDPSDRLLRLYAYPDKSWKVTDDANLPPIIPEPTVGINVPRDGTQRKEWLCLVARYSDAWLISVALFYAMKYKYYKASRKLIFDMINDLPTITEVVTGLVPESDEAATGTGPVSDEALTGTPVSDEVSTAAKPENDEAVSGAAPKD